MHECMAVWEGGCMCVWELVCMCVWVGVCLSVTMCASERCDMFDWFVPISKAHWGVPFLQFHDPQKIPVLINLCIIKTHSLISLVRSRSLLMSPLSNPFTCTVISYHQPPQRPTFPHSIIVTPTRNHARPIFTQFYYLNYLLLHTSLPRLPHTEWIFTLGPSYNTHPTHSQRFHLILPAYDCLSSTWQNKPIDFIMFISRTM